MVFVVDLCWVRGHYCTPVLERDRADESGRLRGAAAVESAAGIRSSTRSCVRVRWWVGKVVRFVCVIRVPPCVSVVSPCVPAVPAGVFLPRGGRGEVVRVRWRFGLVTGWL